MPADIVHTGLHVLSLGGVADDRPGRRLCVYLIGAARVGTRQLLDFILALRRIRRERAQITHQFGKMHVVGG